MKRKDCIHYHCEHDMGASIDCCVLRGLGDCPCSNDCKDYANKNEVYRLGLEVLKQRGIRDMQENIKDDTISRRAAIDAVDVSNLHRGIVSALQEIIRELPPAQPERKTGKWISRDINALHLYRMCSECGFIHDFLDGHIAQYNFCPNCGARMEASE